MTTATLATGNRMTEAVVRPRRSLEELVDRLMDTLFAVNTVRETPSVTRTIHEARRLRQAGDVDGALAVLAGIDVGKATLEEARWAFSEWEKLGKAAVRRPCPAGLQPGRGHGSSPGSHRGRNAFGIECDVQPSEPLNRHLGHRVAVYLAFSPVHAGEFRHPAPTNI